MLRLIPIRLGNQDFRNDDDDRSRPALIRYLQRQELGQDGGARAGACGRPAGWRDRLPAAAKGYRYTIVAGEVTRKDDQFTGARPGRRVRSKQIEAGRKLAAE
jgi:hypothetical protein